MKPKEFQFLVLNTKADWEGGDLDNLTVGDEGVQLRSSLQFFPEHRLRRFDIVDFAVGELAQVYLLDAENRQIILFDSQQNYSESIDFLQDLFDSPTNIAYSPSTIYVADEFQPSNQTRIYAFAHRLNWEVRWMVTLPLGMKPIDMVADRDGTLYILLNIGEQLIAKYDPSGQKISTTGFTRGDLRTPKAIALGSSSNIIGSNTSGSNILTSNTLTSNRDNKYICVLDGETVLRFNLNGSPIESQPRLDLGELIPRNMEPSGLALDREGNFYIGDRRPLGVGEEEERFIFHLSPSGNITELVAGYRGAVTKLVLDRNNRLFIFNSKRQEINILRGEKRLLRPQQQRLPSGIFRSQVLDSTNRGQRWHKIVLDAHIPTNTQIKVYYAISDDPREIHQWSEPLINPRDALIRGPAGRYLYLKVELIGNERETPVLKSLWVYFPRLSYLRYLPAVYQEDEESRDFLERFLSIFETSLTNIEKQIDHIVRYFDPEVVSEDFLPWLAGWLAIAVDENWTSAQLRQLMQKAPQLYQQRGTREGIAATVEIFTGSRPLLVEPFQVTSLANSSANNQVNRSELNQLYGDNPFRFWVLLDNSHIENEKELQTLQRLIESEKPAYTEASVRILQPWIALDRESYLEFNSRIFEPALRLQEGTAISQDSTLTDTEEFAQIGIRSRVSLDTVLN